MRHSQQAAFSLLEVVITLGILMTLTVAVAQMLRSGFDVKQGLSQRAKVIHRLDTSMVKLATDIQSTFFVSTKDLPKNGIGRRTKSVFKIENRSDGDKISLTTMTHKPMNAGAHESDLTYVVYELKPSKDVPGRKNLYRGETKVIPEDLKDDPPMRLLARDIKMVDVEPWDGEQFKNDNWDTGRGDWRNLLPHMVRITIEGWKEDRGATDTDTTLDEGTEKLATVIYIPTAVDYAESKPGASSIKWNNL